MKALGRSGVRPMITAFAIWFAHFLLVWAAAEIWPQQWTANAWAWALTALALLGLGVHHLRCSAQHTAGRLSGWGYRLARGSTALATVAVVFSAWPSLVFLP